MENCSCIGASVTYKTEQKQQRELLFLYRLCTEVTNLSVDMSEIIISNGYKGRAVM